MRQIALYVDPIGVPPYRQIIDQVKGFIADGLVKPGEQLPSIRELAGKLNLSPLTIAKAYLQLETEGYVQSVWGKGVFVKFNRGKDNREGRKEIEKKVGELLKLLKEHRMAMDDLLALIRYKAQSIDVV